MDTVLQNYKQLIHGIAETNSSIVLDNVYPKPVEYLYHLAQPTANPEVLNVYLEAIQFWRDLLPLPSVLPPQRQGPLKNMFHP